VLVTVLPATGVAAAPGRERVVCVSEQINEFLYAINAQYVLVARDLNSVYPAPITNLPSVGDRRALSAQEILSMKPTLLLTDGDVGPEAVVGQVEHARTPVAVMHPGESMEDAQALLLALGTRFGREHEARTAVDLWRQEMAQVLSDSRRLPASKPRVLFMHLDPTINSYMGVGSGTPADQILRWAGGVNAIAATGGMSSLTPELIARLAPDVIVATDVGFDRMGSSKSFAKLPGVSLTPAAEHGRIYRMDESEIMYYGPRTPAAIRHLAQLLRS
jgi:iron complex transport system substrate-binding protein